MISITGKQTSVHWPILEAIWFCSWRGIPATSLITPCLCHFLLTSTEMLCWSVQPAQHTQYSLLTLGLHGQHILVSITPTAEDHGETFMPTPIWPLTSRGMSSILLSFLPDYPLSTSRVAGFNVYLLAFCSSEWLCALQQLVPFSSASQNLAHLPFCIPMPPSLISSYFTFKHLLATGLALPSSRHCLWPDSGNFSYFKCFPAGDIKECHSKKAWEVGLFTSET